ncbi:hypothetical protein [Paenibacillus contaminans]|uniref:Uncharacterized protein n=1 Tax=Paenibacillus contaminans TaxID=450362 RepID=A0A329M9G0_9BACL|nr:hypothetical protein [Paenibacillus contaminans]RAV16759.1 hypothetical protein DQG23_28410 [Paenibacillus contaminans]
MGVKYAREFSDIIEDLTTAIGNIEGCHVLLEMSDEDWGGLEIDERRDCLQTLADDVFYGLGSDPVMKFERTMFTYDKGSHTIRVSDGDKLIQVVRLI